MNSPETIFVINLTREGEKIRISAHEKASGEEQTLKYYEENHISFDEIERLCREVVTLLNRANRRGDIVPEVIDDLKKAGQRLYDELLSPKAKNSLRNTLSDTLVLYMDDRLVHIPWELLFDGEEFLCLKFSIGRIVSTRQNITGIQKRGKGDSFRVLIMADPQGNLDSAYKEGIRIRDELNDKSDKIKVSLVSSHIDIQYVKKNIRDYDVVHYAGHADYNLNEPSKSGWIMSDDRLTASDILKLAGGAPLPSLIFTNACHSGRTGEWKIDEGFENEIYGLANAFLLSGVTHYIGTFWEVLDSPSSIFAIEFYKALARNISIGEAVRIARKHLIGHFGKNNIIWASYMLYGDPTSRVLRLTSDNKSHLSLAAKEKPYVEAVFSHKEGVPRSSGRDPGVKPGISLKKSVYGILAVLILILLFLGIKGLNKYSAKQKPVLESQQISSVLKTTPLELTMNIIGQREEADGTVSEVIIREGSILHSHDNFQVHFNTNKEAYVYILIFDSKGEAKQLFPDPKISLGNKIDGNKEYSVPTAGQWFWLDENVGTETIYVLASDTPLSNIQSILREMAGVTAQKKKALSNKVIDEVKIIERGVGGITEGKTKSFRLKDGKIIESITEIVKGAGALVRAITFRHIDNKQLKFGKETEKKQIVSKSPDLVIRDVESTVNNLVNKGKESSTNEKTIERSLRNIKKNLILEETRGVGGIKVYKEAAPSVVLVVTNEGIGSGSVLDKSGHVLTNWHVIKGYERVVVFFKPEKDIKLKKENAYTAKVIKVDEVSDLALLKIERPPSKLPMVKLGSMQDVEVAQEVHAIGHPEGEIWTYTKGIISQVRPEYEWSYDNRIKHRTKVIQTQTPINPGNSGGPLLNDRAEIIGVNSFTKRGEGLNFAVAVDVIKRFLESKVSRIAQKQLPQKTSKSDILKNAKYYEIDLNKDGITDVVAVDSDGNGETDMYIVDLNQDGVIDYIGIDRDENGKIDVKVYDTNNDGKFDTWAYDTDEDGKFDFYGFDYDGDGEIDEYREA